MFGVKVIREIYSRYKRSSDHDKNKVTSEIIKILNQHEMFKHKTESKFGKQWLNEEEKSQNWFEPVDSNSVMSRLEELLVDFQEISEVPLERFEPRPR